MIIPDLPQDVMDILNRLNEKGYEGFIVGGCVRDSLLGIKPHDWDITTSACPQEVKECFPRTYDTGIQHGTVTVVMGRTHYEVTTYRIDGEYQDGRHPKEVIFTGNLTEDLRRRDFTINAIAYHPKKGYVDPFGGKEDILRKCIRGVGEPAKRFQEDALRMLRAVRFRVQLGFDVEPETKKALEDNAFLIQKVSRERIREELEKLLMGAYLNGLPLLWESGLLYWISPEIRKSIEGKEEIFLSMLCRTKPDPLLRWALFFYFLDPSDVETMMRQLRFDTKTIRTIKGLE